MYKKYLLFVLLEILPVLSNYVAAQVDSMKFDGVKVIVPSKVGKNNNTYFYMTAGYQMPSWIRVPMIPEHAENLEVKGNMNVKVPGWFAGIGIMKRTRSNFEVGILADYYKTTVPVAYSGQRSKSDWVLERNSYLSEFTDVINNDIDRICEVISIRAAIRYKLPAGKFQFWGGLSPGTFSSKIYFSENTIDEPLGIYREISIGLNYEAGIDFLLKDKKGKEMLMFTFFSDFMGPRIEEKVINLFEPGWTFMNTEGNYVINPVRLGFAVGFH